MVSYFKYINNEAKEINIKDKLLKLLTRSIDLNSKVFFSYITFGWN